jgi:hypothetical protein
VFKDAIVLYVAVQQIDLNLIGGQRYPVAGQDRMSGSHLSCGEISDTDRTKFARIHQLHHRD